MDYFSLGSKISYSDFNAIVYLLRKFKRLTSDLRLGGSSISSDYGVYNITGGLASVGGNFILEDTVTISSSDVLLNCFYTFYFTVVDVNLSGTVNRRVVSVTGDTGDNGELSVVLSPDLLESDEVILPEFKVDIVFDEHEYYTPVSQLDITLTVDKSYISVGETATVTATVLDDTGTPVEDLDLQFKVNDTVERLTTDESGVAVLEYTGTGGGWVNVVVIGQQVKFYDGEVTIAEFTGNSIRLGYYRRWLGTTGDVIIDWGDDTQSTVNNPTTVLTHTYSDGESEHSIVFLGTVTSLGEYCFDGCTGLTSVVIPSSVTSLGVACFYGCTGLTSVVIPNSVTSIGGACFNYCSSLIDYQLYWTGDSIITYDSSKMPNNTNTIFTIPYETSSNYISKNYPSNKLRERGLNLELTSDKPIIQSTETSTITATLTHEETPLTSKTLSYQIKHGSTIIDTGTDTTDNNGQISFSYTGTGIGKADVIISYGNLLQETYIIVDTEYYDSCKTDNTLNYSFNTSKGNSLVFETDHYLMTGGTSSRYITYRIDDISSLIGKRIRIEADIKPSNNVSLGIFPHNPEGYVNKTSKWFRDDGTVYFDVTLSDNTIDHILFRVYVNTDYATVELQNIKIYPV